MNTTRACSAARNPEIEPVGPAATLRNARSRSDLWHEVGALAVADTLADLDAVPHWLCELRPTSLRRIALQEANRIGFHDSELLALVPLKELLLDLEGRA